MIKKPAAFIAYFRLHVFTFIASEKFMKNLGLHNKKWWISEKRRAFQAFVVMTKITILLISLISKVLCQLVIFVLRRAFVCSQLRARNIINIFCFKRTEKIFYAFWLTLTDFILALKTSGSGWSNGQSETMVTWGSQVRSRRQAKVLSNHIDVSKQLPSAGSESVTVRSPG